MLEPVNIYWDSCGCMPARPDDLVSVRSDMRNIPRSRFCTVSSVKSTAEETQSFRYHLQHCGTLEDILVEIEKWVAMWHCDSLLILRFSQCSEEFRNRLQPLVKKLFLTIIHMNVTVIRVSWTSVSAMTEPEPKSTAVLKSTACSLILTAAGQAMCSFRVNQLP